MVCVSFSVAEAELMEFEQDLNGHLLIATVCLLAVSKRGLREIELRHLLADEHNLLLEGTKRRNHTNVGYGKQLLLYSRIHF